MRRLVGFSSGALAYANYRHGVEMLYGKDIYALELSALREVELEPLVDGIDELDLSQFKYIAVHAPSAFRAEREEQIVDILARLVAKYKWPVILHPDAIQDFALWNELGPYLCVENMDKRKPLGRTVEELKGVFLELPLASFCFDIGHARQVDPTMTEAFLILKEFGDRLRQVHMSEVNTRSKHDPLSLGSILAFQDVAELIPVHVPVILETPVSENEIDAELYKAVEALTVRELATAD